MSLPVGRNLYFGRIAGLMLVTLSFVGVWKSLDKGYSPILLITIIIVPYAITSILGTLQLFGLQWIRIPTIIACLLGLLINIRETLQYPNRKDIIEVVIFLLILVLTLADYASKRRAYV
jgi:hypothetical protein